MEALLALTTLHGPTASQAVPALRGSSLICRTPGLEQAETIGTYVSNYIIKVRSQGLKPPYQYVTILQPFFSHLVFNHLLGLYHAQKWQMAKSPYRMGFITMVFSFAFISEENLKLMSIKQIIINMLECSLCLTSKG